MSALGFVAVAVLVAGNRGIALDEAVVAAVQALPVPIGAWEAITALGGSSSSRSRSRPVGPLVAASGYSFPSRHSLDSAATYRLIALVAWRSRLPLAVRRLALVLGVGLPFPIGLSRIALGASPD